MKLLRILASYIIFVLLFSSIGICQVCLVDAYTYNERDKRILCIDCDTGKEWVLPYTGHLVDCEYKTYTVCRK